MAWKTLDDMDLSGKVVVTRIDINVPVENGRVTDSTRIDKVAPTILKILEKGGKPVLLAHFGRPKGQPGHERVDRLARPSLRGLKNSGTSISIHPRRYGRRGDAPR